MCVCYKLWYPNFWCHLPRMDRLRVPALHHYIFVFFVVDLTYMIWSIFPTASKVPKLRRNVSITYFKQYYMHIRIFWKSQYEMTIDLLPAHSLLLQGSSWVSEPLQSLPPLDAEIFIVLLRDRFPPPQSFEHELHSE